LEIEKQGKSKEEALHLISWDTLGLQEDKVRVFETGNNGVEESCPLRPIDHSVIEGEGQAENFSNH
jgi:hypothetical protein